MGFFDDLTGKTAADAAKAAAADTYQKQQAAAAGMRQAGDQYANSVVPLAQEYAPWQQTGQFANDAVLRLLQDPSSVRSLSGYQFGLDQGNRNIMHSGVAGSGIKNGKTLKALEGWGIGYADQKFGDQLSRLLGVSQQGLGATQAGVNTQAQGYGGQLGARTSAYGQDFNSAGTIGQGNIAAANAQAKGMSNLLGTGASLLGTALGGPMGGSIGGLLGGLFKSG